MARAQTYEPETPMTRDEFLAWAEQQPSGRFERIDGIVVAMAPDRASHNRRKRAARDALQRAVSKAGLTSCEAFADGMTFATRECQTTRLLHRFSRLAKSASILRGSW